MQQFESKRNALFACLDTAGRDLKGTILDQSGPESHTVNLLKRSAPCAEISSDRTLSKLRGKESIFKKPELPLIKCLKPRVAPDFQVNPHKWMKYSLEDVDISDHTNTAAALSFLKEAESVKDSDEADNSSDGKITFNKAIKVKRSIRTSGEVEDEEVDKPKMKGSKLVMPEYVIGQKPEKDKKKKKILVNTEQKDKQLTLSHLQDEEEE